MMNFTEILNDWIGKLPGAMGPWLGALIIIIIGYIVAKLIAAAVRKALEHTSLDEKLANLMGQDTDGTEKAISKFVFCLLMLFVVFFALSAAGQSEVAEPLQNMFNTVIGFLPKLIAAVVIAIVAWILATVVKNVLVGILTASNVDERLGLRDGRPITNSIGMVAFFAIILMMLPNALEKLEMTQISQPVSDLVSNIFHYLPKLLAGIVIFAIGYLVASIVQKIVKGILTSVNADALPAKIGYNEGNIGGRPLSDIVSYIVMATILVITGAQAIDAMQLEFVSNLAKGMVPGYLRVLLAVILFLAALFIANIVSQLIEHKSPFWARAVRIAIIVFLTAAALQKADITPLTNETFQLIINCAVVAAAFAAGVGGAIAIGLGGKEKASSWLNKIK